MSNNFDGAGSLSRGAASGATAAGGAVWVRLGGCSFPGARLALAAGYGARPVLPSAQPAHDAAVETRRDSLRGKEIGPDPHLSFICQKCSVAAFVPARRALSWQTAEGSGTPVVRERYWLTFQPGEVRLCSSCHGLNTRDQLGQPAPQHAPEALRELLRFWKSEQQAGGKKRAVRK